MSATFGTPQKFVAPEPTIKENPYVAELEGKLELDLLIPATFDADDAAAEKLKVQDAVRRLGFSAREHSKEEKNGKVTITFRIRPERKSTKGKGEAEVAETEADSATE